MERFELKDGWILFQKQFFDVQYADELYNELIEKIDWQQGKIKLFGKTHPIPRLEAFYSLNGENYGYSNKNLIPKTYFDTLTKIHQCIEVESQATFNSVLANYYRDGHDSNGWHADNEKELGIDPVIASISFGAERRFDLKHNLTKEKISFNLSHGSLLLMGGSLQHFWKHTIAKAKKIEEGRINLTFRRIV
jgi:alkylated DNA repair dioxygenase AlkB